MRSEQQEQSSPEPSTPTESPQARQRSAQQTKLQLKPDGSSKDRSSEKAPRGLVPLRSFNHQIIAIGRKGCGKSTWCVKQCLEWAKIPAYVFVHDPGWKIDPHLFDGTPTYTREFSSAAEAREGFAEDPRGIFTISSDEATEVRELAEEVARASVEANGGDKGHPAIFYIDEIVTAGICDPNYLEPGFKRAMAEARHRHIGIIAGVQSARMLNNQLLTLATQIQLFQITDKRDHARLIECGIDEETVRKTAGLQQGQSLTVTL
jgi:hypothetical protein